MTNTRNVVCVYSEDILLPNSLKQQFHEKVLGWIDTIQSVLFYSGEPSYLLRFSKAEDDKVQCNLNISLKFKHWSSEVVGSNVIVAFERALSSLRSQCEPQSDLNYDQCA